MIIDSSHESKLALQSFDSVVELKRPTRGGVDSSYASLKRVGMSNDILEVLDAHDEMQLVLSVEMLEIAQLNGYRRLQRLFEHL